MYARSISLQKNPKVDPSNLLSTVIGYKSIRPTWQMKHGISTEVHAKTKYLSVLRREKHINLTHYDPGRTIMKKHPFISVSTDLDFSCFCCGKGHAEFKCPGSIEDQVPSADNLPYLEIDENGQTNLKRNSDYYFQVQGHMGVTGGKLLISSYLLSKATTEKEFCLMKNSGMHCCQNLCGFGGCMLAQNLSL